MAWSEFVTRLVEAVDKHLGRFSNARLIVKDATAEAEARRLLAQADRDAEDIRSGRMSLVAAASSDGPASASLQLKDAEELTYEQRVIARVTHQELQKDKNIQAIVAHAMAQDNNEDVDKSMESNDDLIARIFNEAQYVSNEDLQEIWGKLLAGAIKQPSFYTVDVVDFLRRLNSDRAYQIARMGPYVFRNAIIKSAGRIEQQFPEGNRYWTRMQHYGLIDGVFVNLRRIMSSTNDDRYLAYEKYGNKLLGWGYEDKNRTIELNAYMFTELGQQVMKLGHFDPDYEYLWQIGRQIKVNYPIFDVWIADIVSEDSGAINYGNKVPIDGN